MLWLCVLGTLCYLCLFSADESKEMIYNIGKSEQSELQNVRSKHETINGTNEQNCSRLTSPQLLLSSGISKDSQFLLSGYITSFPPLNLCDCLYHNCSAWLPKRVFLVISISHPREMPNNHLLLHVLSSFAEINKYFTIA